MTAMSFSKLLPKKNETLLKSKGSEFTKRTVSKKGGNPKSSLPRTILIGTYRHECKKWILQNNLYNFPIDEAAVVFEPELIGWIFLHGRTGEMMKFCASFRREVTSDELKKLGYPVAAKSRAKKYGS